MPAQFDFADRTAVITGAASGIGAALAHGLAARGCRLALADIDREGLDRIAAASACIISTCPTPGRLPNSPMPSGLPMAVRRSCSIMPALL